MCLLVTKVSLKKLTMHTVKQVACLNYYTVVTQSSRTVAMYHCQNRFVSLTTQYLPCLQASEDTLISFCCKNHPEKNLANVSSCANHPERKLANVSSCANHSERKMANVSSFTNHPERKLANVRSFTNHPKTKLAIQKGN